MPIAKTYDYTDESGELLYQQCRMEPKDFRYRRPDPDKPGEWIWSLGDVRRVLYRLPELLQADKSRWVLIVEGEKDADRLAKLGAVVTTSGGADTWRPEYAQFLHDRRVCVLPDNDKGGVGYAAEVMVSVCEAGGDCKIVQLPGLPDKGDVSDWLDAGGTLIKLAELIKKPDETPSGEMVVVKDDRPSTIAAAFEKDSPVKHRFNSIDRWSIYSNDQHQQVKDDNEIRLHIRKFVTRCKVKKHKKQGNDWVDYTEPLKKQTKGFISDIMESLAAMPRVHILPSNKAPCSFDGKLDINTTLAMKNGLLNLSDPQKPTLTALSEQFYTFNYLPVKYDPVAKAPAWIKLLEFYFIEENGTPDIIAQNVLHSWMKRWLLRITIPHKICSLIGEMRSGKSTIARIMCALIGQSSVSSITISSLSGPHGTYGLMNKQLGIMWDAKVVGRTGDIGKAVEVLKNISGQDNMAVNPKGRDIIELPAMKLNILMIANKPADLRDDTGALASRFTFLTTTQTFLGSEDPSMEKHVIEHELPGILNLILAAPDTIIEHPKCAVLSQEFAEMSSPYIAFANDWCDVGSLDMFIPVDILWAYYCEWCRLYNHKPPSAQKFKIEFSSAISGLKRYRPRLEFEDVDNMESEHKLDQRGGRRLTIPMRPQCYKGIDVRDAFKGEWFGQSRSRSGQGGGQGETMF